MRLVTVATFAVALSAAAQAADFDGGALRGTHYGSSALTPIASWEGAYFGGFAGITKSNIDFEGTLRDSIAHKLRETDVETQFGLSGLLEPRSKDAHETAFGAFAGYNMQYDEVVFGFEADYTRARLKDAGTDTIERAYSVGGYVYDAYLTGSASAELRDFGTLRARIGYTIGSFMPFVTGGLALGRADVAHDAVIVLDGQPINGVGGNRGGLYTVNESKEAYSVGFAAGLGVDAMITPNLFVRGEWQYIHFSDFAGVKTNLNTLRAAAAVKF